MVFSKNKTRYRVLQLKREHYFKTILFWVNKHSMFM